MFRCVFRFCLSETSCPQEDNYPNSLCIKVNGKLFPLPVSAFFFSRSQSNLSHPHKDAHKAFDSRRVMHHHQKTVWNRRDREDLSTSPLWSASPPPYPIRFQWHGHLKLEKWEYEHYSNTLYCIFLCLSWTFWVINSALDSVKVVLMFYRRTPCLCTWWGSWHPHCSCRGWGWRASETQTTPEHWVSAQCVCPSVWQTTCHSAALSHNLLKASLEWAPGDDCEVYFHFGFCILYIPVYMYIYIFFFKWIILFPMPSVFQLKRSWQQIQTVRLLQRAFESHSCAR